MSSDEKASELKRPQFGNRFLPKTDDADSLGEETVFKHNAW